MSSTLFKTLATRRNTQYQDGLAVLSTTSKNVLHWSLNNNRSVIIFTTLILVVTIVFVVPRLGSSLIS
ncbi:hypothetical protein, partial [Staphylococcus aureus]